MQHKEKQIALSNEALEYCKLLKESIDEEQEMSSAYSPLIILSLAKLNHIQNGTDGIKEIKELLDKI